MADKRVASRMGKEIDRLKKEPPHGVTCWPKDSRLNHLEVNLLGGESTPYEGGIFKLEVKIPNRYPFEPPHVQFLTKIYHPNIDTAGRICLDILKSPPTGSWKPAHNLHTILTSIQLLMAEPNPDDGLMADISSEYKHQKPTFLTKAKEWTDKYAKSSTILSSSISPDTESEQNLSVKLCATLANKVTHTSVDVELSESQRAAMSNKKRKNSSIDMGSCNKRPCLDRDV